MMNLKMFQALVALCGLATAVSGVLPQFRGPDPPDYYAAGHADGDRMRQCGPQDALHTRSTTSAAGPAARGDRPAAAPAHRRDAALARGLLPAEPARDRVPGAPVPGPRADRARPVRPGVRPVVRRRRRRPPRSRRRPRRRPATPRRRASPARRYARRPTTTAATTTTATSMAARSCAPATTRARTSR